MKYSTSTVCQHQHANTLRTDFEDPCSIQYVIDTWWYHTNNNHRNSSISPLEIVSR